MSGKKEPTVLTRFAEHYLDEVTALYNHPAITRQLLQMPYQSSDIWRKRLRPEDERGISPRQPRRNPPGRAFCSAV